MKISQKTPKILVIGSSSIDLVINAPHHPQVSESVMATKSETFFGGKGANQAVGTARLGASVYFVSSVGMDPYGQQILRNLKNEGVNVGFVFETSEADTGTAYVTAAEGKNATVVVPSANYHLMPKHIDLAEKFFESADFILTQLEIPMETVEHVFRLAKKHGKKIGIYAVPAVHLSEEIVDYATFIVAKRNDLSIIFEKESNETILKKLPNKLFLRDDTNSTIYYNGTEKKFYRNDPEQVAHKMGMGDAFTSGFTIAMCHGNDIETCVKFGNDVSLKVSNNRGSQRGLPYLKNFE